MTRETVLVQTFVEIADTLVDDFDVVDLLTVLADRCIELLDVDAAGLMIASADGELRVLGSSSNAMRLLELFEVQAEQGPCFEAYLTGVPVFGELGDPTDDRWDQFAPRAIEADFQSVHALPMRLRGHTIGARTCSAATRARSTTRTSPPPRPSPTWPPSPCSSSERQPRPPRSTSS